MISNTKATLSKGMVVEIHDHSTTFFLLWLFSLRLEFLLVYFIFAIAETLNVKAKGDKTGINKTHFFKHISVKTIDNSAFLFIYFSTTFAHNLQQTFPSLRNFNVTM